MIARYRLDPANSRFTAQAFASGLLSFLGHSPTFAIRDFGGEVAFDPDAPQTMRVRVTVKADSLQLEDRVGAGDRNQIEGAMRGEALETARYPEIGFESAEVAAGPRSGDDWPMRIGGRLLLHEAIRPVALDARLTLYNDGVRLAGGCAVSQAAFGMKPVVALGGTLRLRDEVRIAFNVVGWKMDEGGR